MLRIKNSSGAWLCLAIFVLGATHPPVGKEPPPAFRALFVSVIQDPQVLASEDEMDRLVAFAKKADIKIIFVQIYRANKAWFPSQIADDRPYQDCLKAVGEDPLALLIKKAHREGLEVHAWLNLLSLSANTNAKFLEEYGAGVLTRNLQKKKKLEDYKIDNQYFLEPGDPRVREDLVKIVKEILMAYKDLDGIQFDYIRYPDVKPHYGYTEANMERFKKATGLSRIEEKNLRWKDWKRDQVTELLRILVKRSRSLRPQIQISSTGCMPYSRAYHEAFQDWASWLDQGIVDFVTVMNYSDNPDEYAQWNQQIKEKVGGFANIVIGVGAYKFLAHPQVFAEEMRICESSGASCAIFHYGSLLENKQLKNSLIRPR